MRLSTINRVLNKMGLVLVVAHADTKDGPEPTRLWVERQSTYDARAGIERIMEDLKTKFDWMRPTHGVVDGRPVGQGRNVIK